MVNTLLRAYFDVCRFRLGPQDLPASHTLLAVTLAVYGLSEMLLNLFDLSARDAGILGILAPTIMLAFTAVLLILVRLGSRWVQTSTAFAGTGIVFSLIALPLVAWVYFSPEQTLASAFGRTLLLAVLFWNLAVIAHIWKQALSTNIVVGASLAITFYLLSFYLISSVIDIPMPDNRELG